MSNASSGEETSPSHTTSVSPLSILVIVAFMVSKLPDLSPVLKWISHVLWPEYVGLVVANAHHTCSIEVDILYFLGAIALVYTLLRLATIDIEGLSA